MSTSSAVEATSTENLEALQSAEQRTQTVPVTSRIVAFDDEKNPQEVSRIVKVFVRPLPMKRWFVAIKLVTGMLSAFPQVKIDLSDMSSLAMFAAQLLGTTHAEVVQLMSLATDQDEAFFDTIDLDEGLKIVLAVIEVNKDFFVQKVLPMIQAVAPELQAKVQETFGQTQ